MELIIKKEKVPSLKGAVLVEGLPGIGNVARIATDFLIEKLNAKRFMTIYSYSFPNSVFINQDSTVELPKIELYYSKKPKIVILIGDAQPVDEQDSYVLAEKIVDIVKKLGIKEIITLGGIGLPHEPQKPKVFGATNNKKIIGKFKKHGVIFDGATTVGIIIGATGLLLGMAKLKKMNAVALLAQTFGNPAYFGFRASKSILEVLMKYFGIKYSLKDIEKEIHEIEKKKKRKIKKIKSIKDTRTHGVRYIG
jgi:uncharacterized protein (TIGR00162 family)